MKAGWIIAGGLVTALLVVRGVHRGMGRSTGRTVAVPGVDTAGHARRVPVGYILSGMFEARHVPALAAAGVRLVLSAVNPASAAREALRRAGITWVPVPLGAHWRNGQEILQAATQYQPNTTFIHCTHGADRTGAITAFLLVMRHGWTIPDALYAVVVPTTLDVGELGRLLRAAGYNENRTVQTVGVGAYSLKPLGLWGGMKVRGDYGIIVRELIVDLQARGKR